MTRNLAAVLLVVVLLLVLADRRRAARKRRQRALAEGDDPGAPGRPAGGGVWTVVSVLLSLALLGVGGATGTYLFLVGDSGARMVWEGTAER
jgi:ABC-type Fe3+ transport system permease subunit